MHYEVPTETIRVLSPLYCECGKAVSKHTIVCSGLGVVFICTHCHKTLLELKLAVVEVGYEDVDV